MSTLFCPQTSRFPAFFSCPRALIFEWPIKVLCGSEPYFVSITIQEHCLLSFLFSFTETVVRKSSCSGFACRTKVAEQCGCALDSGRSAKTQFLASLILLNGLKKLAI